MPTRSLRARNGSDSLLGEAGLRLPLFEDLPPDTLERLAAAGFGRGFLTASLRARLRKAGIQDLGQLARSSPDAIAGVRKFGPVRVERVRVLILDAIARWLPDARTLYADEAVRTRRLGRLGAVAVDRLPLQAGALAALGLAGESCAVLAGRSRHELLGTGHVTSDAVDGVVTALAGLLGAGGTWARLAAPMAVPDPAAPDAEAVAARRAANLAAQDRDWEAAAPVRDRPRGRAPREA